jgi:hypothetical protein
MALTNKCCMLLKNLKYFLEYRAVHSDPAYSNITHFRPAILKSLDNFRLLWSMHFVHPVQSVYWFAPDNYLAVKKEDRIQPAEPIPPGTQDHSNLACTIRR